MAPRALPPAAPAALRVVKAVAGKSLVVAIPRHSGKKATLPSNKAETLTNSRSLPAYDREFWRKFSYTPIALKISTVLRRLGLRQLNSGPGKIVFYHNNVIQLSDAISDLAKSLPTTLEELLDVAVEEMPLRQEVANILNRHGDSIWGSGKERPWLLKACEGDVEYQKDLDFDSKTDDDVIRHYLRLWILIKAFNHTRNKIKPSARTVKADTDAYKTSEKPRTLTDSRKFQEPIIDGNERVYGVLVDDRTEVRETLVAKETRNPTLLIAKDLPLNKYWDEKDWQVYYSHIHEQEIFLATVRSLGMRVTPRYATSSSPTIEHFEALGKDIREISQKLSSVFSAAELFRYAEDRKFLDGEITLLLETHSTIWSFDSNRKKLLAPGEDVNYPRDLFFENDEDQKILRMHLHRWIFLMTLKNCEQKQGLTTNAVQPSSLLLDDVDGSRANSSEYESDNVPVFDQNESAALLLDSDTFDITNSDPDIPEPRVQKGLLDHETPREPGADPLEAPEAESATKRKQRPPSSKSESLFASNSAILPQRASRQQRKRKTIDSENLEAQNASRPSKQPRNDHEHVPHPGHDLSALFVSYLENHGDPGFNEAVALDNLAKELLVLKQHVPVFHSKRKTKLTKAFLTVSFPAWLSYREDIVAIKRMYVATQTTEETSHRHRVVLERSRLATQLRQAHETFMDAGSAGMRPEEVVFRVTMLLMDEDGESEAAAAMRDGFESLEEELITLCDDLMKSGGAKWILGDFPPVSSLEGMKSF
ncbi:hypothetical protein E8E13_008845 [Curvularia kusanoi]|uniref:Uncharacterized protein n=1 Tax=Curvularia kusanoi TaxID=90978 RepID=A0A9P4TDH5_CURKU|nr:hypothetical protein E8E13_008845 [Curvularia kusanoi]